MLKELLCFGNPSINNNYGNCYCFIKEDVRGIVINKQGLVITAFPVLESDHNQKNFIPLYLSEVTFDWTERTLNTNKDFESAYSTQIDAIFYITYH